MSGPLSQLKPVSNVPANAAIPKYAVWFYQIRDLDRTWPTNLKGSLRAITDEVKLYDQAFSPMAKRNVAMSIVGRIGEFQALWKRAYAFAPLPPLLAELDAAARKEAAASVSGHKYDYVSCVGYGVKTGKFDEHLFSASWSGTDWKFNGLVAYAGAPADKVDYLTKCLTLRNVIDSAYSQYQAAHGSSPNDARTLKIFMAPEFFFRGRKGAYETGCISDIFDNLRTFTSDPKYKDWLFVFGTAIGASFDDRLVCRNCGKSGASQFVRTGPNQFSCAGCPPNSVTERRLGARIDNVALIQKGGEDDFKNAHVVEKEYVSHIDFRRYASSHALKLGETATGFSNAAIMKGWGSDRRIEIMGGNYRALPVPGSRDVGGSASKFTDERMGGSIFTIDGIKFGLEICLDHLKGRIPTGTGIQVQLVPSAGASLKQLTCVANGIGFNVDGLSANCDVQVNASGGATKVTAVTGSAPGGGSIKIFPPQALPYS